MLNAAQVARRMGRLTGSRIACLMTGDVAKIDQLYREMIGEALPEDLGDNWPVQLGSFTEPLNLDWYERKHKQEVSRRGDVVFHPLRDWAAVTLDGWIDELECPIECKHVGGREPLEVLVDRYAPQCQWQMEVTGADQCAFSVIMGANEPAVHFIERNVDYADEMIRRGEQFMHCVRTKTPPVTIAPPVEPPVFDQLVTMDMSADLQWQAAAQQWLQTHGAAETAENMEKVLKSLVPADARKCHGWGVMITRSRPSARSPAGSLSLREERR